MNVITLSNGLKVGNFSSPHDFTFEDGSILPKVSNLQSEELKVTFLETEVDSYTVELDFDLSQAVLREMTVWSDLHIEGGVDYVICPLPMITALKKHCYVPHTCFRAIRVPDRINKLCAIDKFTC